jgi:DNA replication licensing factor MCM2
MHLMMKEPTLAIWLADAPRDMLEVLNDAATKHVLRVFPSYKEIQDEIHIRITDTPITDSLRVLRKGHLDTLIKVNGVVTRRSSVYPQLKIAFYDCVRCKGVMGPHHVDESSMMSSSGPDGRARDAATLHLPSACPFCSSEGPFRLNTTRSEYRNYQRINLQETPGSVPPGRVPRTKEVILTNDLIDVARPGEEIEITGIYSHSYDYHLTQKSGFPVFSTFIFANHVRRKEDASAAINLSDLDKAQILELAADPRIGERIVESIAPSIHESFRSCRKECE